MLNDDRVGDGDLGTDETIDEAAEMDEPLDIDFEVLLWERLNGLSGI